MPERRYGDGEVRKILEVATRADDASLRPADRADGLTLSEIQGIAAEVGVHPDAVTRAAAALDATTAARRRRSWGMPIEVGRLIPLSRAMSDEEWDRLVAELRATFRARGKVVVQGSLREWSNGNLHAAVEPADEGYRLRLGTLKGDAAGLNMLGATGIAAGAVVGGAAVLSGAAPDIAGPLVLGLSGAGAILANLVRLPRWANQRERQMAKIEATVRRIMSAPADAELDG